MNNRRRKDLILASHARALAAYDPHAPAGEMRLTPHYSNGERQMAFAGKIMRDDREILRSLARRRPAIAPVLA